jgi:glutamyl-tRNA synthetase
MSEKKVRVRIAPSPSGNLHVGTARTALFNYLFAKKMGGYFVLRIEDTDLERSDEKYIQNIFDSLRAIGLMWDEGPDKGGNYGPYCQSQKFETYKKYAEILKDKGFAYECYCTQEELEAEKAASVANKVAHKYSGRCKNLTPEQVAEFQKEGRVPTVRFIVPQNEKITFEDLAKGHLEFDSNLVGDFVIMKSNGTPTYNFAVVIDDIDMEITHILRGEDHISNTAKQVLIYEALDAEIPEFAHLGMILAPDRSKLSKRHGATAVSEFIEQGYLPEAFVNFIALLGWSPSDGQEIKSLSEIIADFDINRLSSSNSIFEFDKLNWMNGQYIRSLPVVEILERAKFYLKDFDLSEYNQAQLERIVEVVREPLTLLSEISDAVSYFFGENINIDSEIQTTVLDTDISQKVLVEFEKVAQTLEYSEEALHHSLEEFRGKFKEQGIKPKDTMWAIRAALTGRTKGADISAVIALLGKDKVIARVQKAVK